MTHGRTLRLDHDEERGLHKCFYTQAANNAEAEMEMETETDSGRGTGAGQRFGYGISGSVSALHRSPALLGVAGGVVADAGWPQKCNRLVKPMAK